MSRPSRITRSCERRRRRCWSGILGASSAKSAGSRKSSCGARSAICWHTMPAEQTTRSWKDLVFKNRGLLLVPIALVLIVFGRPSLDSAIIGIVVAAAGELLRIWAVGYSGVTTRANVVTAPQLVTAGPYSRMRNPLYVGNAIIALGFWTAFSGRVPLWIAAATLLCVIVLIGGVYGVIVPLEERYLEQQFGGSTGATANRSRASCRRASH